MEKRFSWLIGKPGKRLCDEEEGARKTYKNEILGVSRDKLEDGSSQSEDEDGNEEEDTNEDAEEKRKKTRKFSMFGKKRS